MIGEVMSHRSSFIAQTMYDRTTDALEITFTDGKTFHYEGVPRAAYIELITSGSIGSHFQRSFKHRFDGEEV